MRPQIFNSLGANYRWNFVCRALVSILSSDKNANTRLKKILSDKYQGEAYLFYKGRDAIEFALRSIFPNLPKTKSPTVLTQGFTCFAIEEAIRRAGWQPAFVDIAENSLNPSLVEIKDAYKKNGQPAAIILQHTLGQPANIAEIKSWCNENGVILIEDLAQSMGGQYEDRELGMYGDIVVTSFGRDKVVDAISGGAAIIKPGKQSISQSANKVEIRGSVPTSAKILDLIYPILTKIIRSTFSIYFGKLFLFTAKRLKILSSPLKSSTSQPAQLPANYAPLILLQHSRLTQQLKHRRLIAEYYFDQLKNRNDIVVPISREQIISGANLRFPLIVDSSEMVRKTLKGFKENNIYLTDRWYRSAVDCSTLDVVSNYNSGSCPRAEYAAKRIINLPTHQYISRQSAERIVAVLKKSLES